MKAPKAGWKLVSEPPPSLVKHHLPEGLEALRHRQSYKCECEPIIQNEPQLGYSVVLHN